MKQEKFQPKSKFNKISCKMNNKKSLTITHTEKYMLKH